MVTLTIFYFKFINMYQCWNSKAKGPFTYYVSHQGGGFSCTFLFSTQYFPLLVDSNSKALAKEKTLDL